MGVAYGAMVTWMLSDNSCSTSPGSASHASAWGCHAVAAPRCCGGSASGSGGGSRWYLPSSAPTAGSPAPRYTYDAANAAATVAQPAAAAAAVLTIVARVMPASASASATTFSARVGT